MSGSGHELLSWAADKDSAYEEAEVLIVDDGFCARVPVNQLRIKKKHGRITLDHDVEGLSVQKALDNA